MIEKQKKISEITEQEIDEWFEQEEAVEPEGEVTIQETSKIETLFEKYSNIQLKISQTSSNFLLSSLKTQLSDPNHRERVHTAAVGMKRVVVSACRAHSVLHGYEAGMRRVGRAFRAACADSHCKMCVIPNRVRAAAECRVVELNRAARPARSPAATGSQAIPR